jgi:CheY-like chemotaxis protein
LINSKDSQNDFFNADPQKTLENQKFKNLVKEDKKNYANCLNEDNNNNNIDDKIVKISVIDSGIGIKQDELETLKKFRDICILNSSKNYNQEGSGLGLSISYFLIGKLEHKILAESTYGKGSSFAILIKPEKENFSVQNDNINFFTESVEDKNYDFKLRTSNTWQSKAKDISLFSKNKYRYDQCNKQLNFKANPLQSTSFKLNAFNPLINKYINKNNNDKNVDNCNIKIKKTYSCNNIFNKIEENKCIKKLRIKFDLSKPFVDNEKQQNDNYNINKKNSKNFLFFDFENTLNENDNQTKKLDDHEINKLLSDLKPLNKNSKEKNKNCKKRKKINLKNNFHTNTFRNSFKKQLSPNEFNSTFSKDSNNELIRFKNKNNFNINIVNKEYNTYSQNIFLEKSSSIIYRAKNNSSSRSKYIKDRYLSIDSENISCLSFNKKTCADTNKKIILIVDDHKYVRESFKNLIKKILEKKNLTDYFAIKEGNDGCELIDFVIKDQFNGNKITCAITDENMEFINGSDAIKILRDLEKHKKIKPIVIASNTAFEDEIMKSVIKNVGIDYFIPKPSTENILNKFFEEFKIFEIENLKD